jgi:hypothetical protein
LNFKILFKRYKMTTGMRGFVYVDRETSQVMRFTAEADVCLITGRSGELPRFWTTTTPMSVASAFCCRSSSTHE